MSRTLAEFFRYNRWANEQIIAACRALTDEQLDAHATGTHGPIRRTLVHMIDGQRSFLARLDGHAQPPDGPLPRWSGFDAIADLAATTGDALIAAAGSIDEDSEVVLAFMGKRYQYPKIFFLLHAIEHGIEHRTQINVMLPQLGIEHPDLDGWPYAAHAGFGTEV